MNALLIENVKDEFLPAFKELAKAFNATLTIQNEKQDFIEAVKKT